MQWYPIDSTRIRGVRPAKGLINSRLNQSLILYIILTSIGYLGYIGSPTYSSGEQAKSQRTKSEYKAKENRRFTEESECMPPFMLPAIPNRTNPAVC